jgi:hypothetical protein
LLLILNGKLMNLFLEHQKALTRRQFFQRTSRGIGTLALASLLNDNLFAGAADPLQSPGALPRLHFQPRARRVIYLFMGGGPSQLELFDPKPRLTEMVGKDLPPSVRMGQRLTAFTNRQPRLPLVGSAYPFVTDPHTGTPISSLLPCTAKIVREIAIIRSMYTEPINHDPAITFVNCGSPQPGRPPLGSWLSYGLGTDNQNLPAFVVLLSGHHLPIQGRYWHNAFLPSNHQGVEFRAVGDPVLFVSNPKGMDQAMRRDLLDGVKQLNQLQYESVGDPEIAARIEAYELAYRMQTSVPELMDIAKEPKALLDAYGAEPGKASFANNCLLARRLAERGVRFIQLYDREWDDHLNLPTDIKKHCQLTDKPIAALITDLRQRGLLEDTLVIWGGEFGRTAYSQGPITKESFGRDHHPRCFTMWLAGGGIKRGITYGKTDDFSYNVVENPVQVNDLHATILHCLGIDHTKLTYRFQGRDFRLTDVHGNVVKELLA